MLTIKIAVYRHVAAWNNFQLVIFSILAHLILFISLKNAIIMYFHFFYLCDNDPDLTFFPIIINLQFQYNVNVNIIFLSQRHKINQGAQE